MKHYASSRLWAQYSALPEDVRTIAEKNHRLLKQDPQHPSRHFKKVGELWPVRVGVHHRALGSQVADGVVWF